MQRPDMTIAVDWDVKHQCNIQTLMCMRFDYSFCSGVFNVGNLCVSVIHGIQLWATSISNHSLVLGVVIVDASSKS